jgi:L-lactate dehydrogenase (cytochrome)
MRLSDCHSIDDLRCLSERVLPRPIFDYMDGGAEDEFALRRSVSAFDNLDLLPRMLVDVSRISTEVEVFGKRIPFPIMLAPTGLTRLFHKDAELAVATAASAVGLPYCLSTMGTTTIEEFARATSAPKLFQIYIFKDRGLTEEFVERARACAYNGLVLTVDTVVTGKRRRDLANGLSLPPRLTFRSWLDFAAKPRWSLPALFGRKFEFVNVSHRVKGVSGGSTSLQAYVASQFDRTLTWRDVEWLAGKWSGPLAIKGILTPEDARQAVECGADTVMVSNHGGRQLETAAAPIEQIAPIAEAVAGRARIICDGGVRRGTHILKALALGADACSIGRSYLYGLAAGGAAGVSHALRLLTEELERSMILAGVASLENVDSGLIRRIPHGP